MKNFTDFQNGVATRIQDAAAILAQADRDALITQAVQQRYSKDRPRVLVTDVAGNGSNLLALPTDSEQAGTPVGVFEDGFSQVRAIEFPIGELPPTYIEDPDWMMYRAPAGLKILLLLMIAQQSDTLRLTWTCRHSAGGPSSANPVISTTVPDADFEAVCDLAAALCFEALAAFYAQTRDPSIGADAVNYRTKSQEYLSLAKPLRKRYDDHVGVVDGDSGTSASGAAIAIGGMYEVMGSGIDRLTHRRPR